MSKRNVCHTEKMVETNGHKSDITELGCRQPQNGMPTPIYLINFEVATIQERLFLEATPRFVMIC